MKVCTRKYIKFIGAAVINYNYEIVVIVSHSHYYIIVSYYSSILDV